jgi:hypothetical protein
VKKYLIAALFVLLSSGAVAGPNQLDVLGLVAGVSSRSQVKDVAVPRSVEEAMNGDYIIELEIGGHKIPCNVSFYWDKLANLSCLTGKISDRQVYTDASNITIYNDLVKGFSMKFGKPDHLKSNPVRTKLGVEHIQDIALWIDAKGNRLLISSMEDTTDIGFITFSSAERLKNVTDEYSAKEAKKKF